MTKISKYFSNFKNKIFNTPKYDITSVSQLVCDSDKFRHGLAEAKVYRANLFPYEKSSKNPLTAYFTEVPKRTIGIFSETKNDLINTINSINDDLSKILEYNRITAPNSKFVVIDKAKSKATVYEGNKVIADFDAGVGEVIGDSLNTVSYNYKTKTFSQTGRTTPSGEFLTSSLPEICENKGDFITKGNTNVILLNGVMHPSGYKQNTSLAIHQLPNSLYEQRMKILNEQTGRKGCSTGCINLKTEDYLHITKLLPEGSAVYILPEEAGNSLKLAELPDGRLWFQTVYKDAERNNMLESAIEKFCKTETVN